MTKKIPKYGLSFVLSRTSVGQRRRHWGRLRCPMGTFGFARHKNGMDYTIV